MAPGANAKSFDDDRDNDNHGSKIMHGIETLKARIQSGEKIVGASIRMWATKADIDQTMSQRNYDFLAVDAQHSPFNEENLANVCDTANEMGIPIQLRIKHTQFTYLIGNMLDLGPSMIEVPQVEDMDTVHDAVANFNYPQKGRRSWAPSRSPQSTEYPQRLEYAEWWNAHGVIWMQLESIKAVTQSKEMAAAGADVLSWGPNDLAFNREANPDHFLKTDDDCINHVLKELKGTQTTLCLRTYSDEQLARYEQMGATMFLDEANIASAPD
jgi:2-keto-3-deoxy-L-rhamnonate aldolase RhmA